MYIILKLYFFFWVNSIIIVAVIVIYFEGGPGGELVFLCELFFFLFKKVVGLSLDFKSCGK